jgi:hypothetical protein
MATEGSLIAVAQAGKQAVVLLQCALHNDAMKLTMLADVVIETVSLPSRLCFVEPNSLWAVGVSSCGSGKISAGRAVRSAGEQGLLRACIVTSCVDAGRSPDCSIQL